MELMKLIAVLSLVFLGNMKLLECSTRSFTIDYERNTFVKDGRPFRYISGSMHYARVHPLYWQDRLKKMYMAGLDAVQTYVPWNLHEPQPGIYNFDDGADLELFLKTAQANGLLVILRAGPYICGEWDMGGLPAWLLKNHSIQLRTSDEAYLRYVDQWMGVLLPKVKPYLYANGGPIITVQIENEYGSYPACDHNYMSHLLQVFKSHLGNDVVFFTTDGANANDLKCGTVSGAYATVDFGPGGDPSSSFKMQRQFEPKGPLVNSEYYTGWLDHWGFKHETRDATTIVKFFDEILKLGANINMYMFEGGTNFAFWNGANGNTLLYMSQPTSYDYDAPLSEAGDPREKYHVIRQLIGKYKKLPPGPIPPATPKIAYGKTTMKLAGTIYDILEKITPVETDNPITMEDGGQNFGFMLYSTVLRTEHTKPANLHIAGIRDRGYVLVDKKPVGILQRYINESIEITNSVNSTLDILVENMGRLNYGCCINDSKGIISNVTLGGTVLKSWQIYYIKNTTEVLLREAQKFIPSRGSAVTLRDTPSGSLQVPSLFVGTVPTGEPKGDTFLKMIGWSKGQAFINGFNLGRYWPTKGPQITLYVPVHYLHSTANIVTLFETEHAPCDASNPSDTCTVEFVNTPILNSTDPPVAESFRQLTQTDLDSVEMKLTKQDCAST